MSYVAGVIKKQLDEHEARRRPTALVLEMVAKLSPEVRMLALGFADHAREEHPYRRAFQRRRSGDPAARGGRVRRRAAMTDKRNS
jgi:hypothetical protein